MVSDLVQSNRWCIVRGLVVTSDESLQQFATRSLAYTSQIGVGLLATLLAISSLRAKVREFSTCAEQQGTLDSGQAASSSLGARDGATRDSSGTLPEREDWQRTHGSRALSVGGLCCRKRSASERGKFFECSRSSKEARF